MKFSNFLLTISSRSFPQLILQERDYKELIVTSNPSHCVSTSKTPNKFLLLFAYVEAHHILKELDILHLKEISGGGQDVERDDGARAARRPPVVANRMDDVENVGGGQARLEAQVEQMFDGLDDVDGAEDVPFDELVGMQAPVFHLVENAFTQGGGSCFGFVEFESLESVKSALKASTLEGQKENVVLEYILKLGLMLLVNLSEVLLVLGYINKTTSSSTGPIKMKRITTFLSRNLQMHFNRSMLAARLLRHYFLLLLIDQMAAGLFRVVAGVSREMVIANTLGSFVLLVVLLLGGYIMSRGSRVLSIFGMASLPHEVDSALERVARSEWALNENKRKALTIVVGLVANPSIIFMDEPTSGLDAERLLL
ncbi:hypothetical protein IFM89_028920 [Coptis chinensis]|uniref:ABC-2 type transporter transmembrane domain-containing protein n=1 Tax=Coptis chinensis TaxID=261450 RepID=A0A835LG52_9MAGN|nr:hypothetical protein IFM89_028920 [Coptis chinensis]